MLPDHFSSPVIFNAPEQVHITQGDNEGRGIIISWVTPVHKNPNVVTYWEAEGAHSHRHKVHAATTSYRYYNYTSGFLHHETLRKLKYDTRYIYELGKHNAAKKFSFTTPPKVGPDVPYTFGVMGDLGQTYNSNQTFEHYVSNPKGKAKLFVGDLSYAVLE